MPSARNSTTEPAFAELLELLGRRWTLRLLWELRGGHLAFNDLRVRAGGLSQSVLVTRLTELFGAGLVEDVEGGYRLTDHGTAVVKAMGSLDRAAGPWARR